MHWPGGAYSGDVLADEARELARRSLAEEIPRRWAHVCAVAAKAETVAADLGLPRDLLVTAAWLHDIGYAADVKLTGFHPLDGARHLRHLGVDERVVTMVAHHSCASVEADERGLEAQLQHEFPVEPGVLADALIFCDMTTGPNGEQFAVEQRLYETPITENHDRPMRGIRGEVVLRGQLHQRRQLSPRLQLPGLDVCDQPRGEYLVRRAGFSLGRVRHRHDPRDRRGCATVGFRAPGGIGAQRRGAAAAVAQTPSHGAQVHAGGYELAGREVP
ncbi:MAG TPA: HDIG domain-containing protein [Sporichthyaceae bacterium]|jgi:putative nucleotidyltransferase with HDIG domain|nr:HDIG domain-containing protein [Sporichthyaceae bacterium]